LLAEPEKHRKAGYSVLVQRELEKPRFGISFIFES